MTVTYMQRMCQIAPVGTEDNCTDIRLLNQEMVDGMLQQFQSFQTMFTQEPVISGEYCRSTTGEFPTPADSTTQNPATPDDTTPDGTISEGTTPNGATKPNGTHLDQI